jgi:two-component system invasion response regulator UvrY
VAAATKILVVDDHELVRRGIRTLLASDPSLIVISEAADGEDAVEKAREFQPEIILLDITLPGISGIEAARRIRHISPTSRIILVSQHDTFQMAIQGFGAGARGYVAKIDAALDVLNAIHSVREGRRFVSQRLLSMGWQIDVADPAVPSSPSERLR